MMNYRKPTTTEIKKIENYLKDYLKNVKKYSESTVIPFAEFFDYENETNAPKYHLTQVENDKCQFINCIQTDEYFNLKMKQYKKHNQQQTVSYADDYPKNFSRFKLKIIRCLTDVFPLKFTSVMTKTQKLWRRLLILKPNH